MITTRLRLLMVRHPGFHPVNTGSIPVGVTTARPLSSRLVANRQKSLELPFYCVSYFVTSSCLFSWVRRFHGGAQLAPFVEAQGSTAASYIVEDDGDAGSTPALVIVRPGSSAVEHVESLSRLSFLRFDERR